MKTYYIYKNGLRYNFTFYSLWAACLVCNDLRADCVVDAETGEVLMERE